MHEREFEKDVQHKMQDLRFKPNPDVWARVQADIQKKKRRRPVVMWFLLGALLTGGAASLLLIDRSDNRISNNRTPNDRISKDQTKNSTTAPIEHLYTEKKGISNRRISNNRLSKDVTSNTQQTPFNNPTEEITTEEITTTEVLGPVEVYDGHAWPDLDRLPRPRIAIKQPTVQQKTTPPETQNKKPETRNTKHQTQWGVTAGAGISDLGKDPFQNTRVADLASLNSAPPAAMYNPTYRPSEITAGPSMHIGAYVSKGISNKLRVKLGLNYENYSNQIKVGSYVDSARMLNQGQGNYRMLDNFYSPGNSNKYTNKYHFISVPASIQWQLTRNDNRGIVWENGIAFSQLLGSDALYYDGASAAYFKDNSVIRKTQWIASSSVLFTMKTKNNMQLYAGPQIQYGLSNLVNNDALKSKHLRYAGIKLAVGFNKN